MHCGPLAPVEHPALEEGRIGSLAHLAAQGIDFPHQMSLGGTADGGIAGHIGHSVQGEGKQHGTAPQTGSGKGSFHTGMTGADYRHINGSGFVTQNNNAPFFPDKKTHSCRQNQTISSRKKPV